MVRVHCGQMSSYTSNQEMFGWSLRLAGAVKFPHTTIISQDKVKLRKCSCGEMRF